MLDFGIAKAIEGEHKLDQFETLDGTVFGTPRYMSPEQAQGKPLDQRSDLYAVGIVLYELLVGAPPFVDRDAVVVMAKHIRDEPAPLRRSAPDAHLPAEPAARARQGAAQGAGAALPERRGVRPRARALPARRRAARAHAAARAASGSARALGAPTLDALGGRRGRARVARSRARRRSRSAAARRRGARKPPRQRAAPRRARQCAAPASRARRPRRPAAAPETHIVTLYSEPKGANVWHDSRFVGVTPLPIEVPDGKALRVRVSMAGLRQPDARPDADEGARVVTLERSHAEAAARCSRRADARATGREPPARDARNAEPRAKTAPTHPMPYEKF